MTISAIPKQVPATLAPPVNVAAVGCAADGAVALDTGETPVPVPVPAVGRAGKLGAMAEVDNVTVKADVDEEVSASADVRVDVAVVEEVEGAEEVEEVEEGIMVSVDPGMTVAVAVAVADSSVAGISIVPVLIIKVLVWQSRA